MVDAGYHSADAWLDSEGVFREVGTRGGRAPREAPVSLRVAELYCGIGGCAAALAPLGDGARVAAALDVSHLAVEAYRHAFPGHPAVVRTLESIPAAELAGWEADLWWLSPPCQPFTRRGLGRDLDDPRTASLVALAGALGTAGPPLLALENVPGFAGSRTHRLLRGALAATGYAVRERLLCPTELGWPNRRRRFYLLASRRGWAAEPENEQSRGPGEKPEEEEELGGVAPAGRPALVAELLDPRPEPGLEIDPALVKRYAGALDLVDPDDPAAVTACFTAAYGRSPVRSGSYLVTGREPDGAPRLRRFSVAEVLRLLGFPEWFALPPGTPREVGWRLAGNSLSVPAVRTVLAALPGLEGLAGVPPRAPYPASALD
jgi:site-specific DNA-cytosine methylase